MFALGRKLHGLFSIRTFGRGDARRQGLLTGGEPFDFLGGLADLRVDLPLNSREGKHRSDASFDIVQRGRTVLLQEFGQTAAGFAEFFVD